jgi:hypothetical protein
MSDPIGRSSTQYHTRDIIDQILSDLYKLAQCPAVDQEEDLAKYVWSVIEKWEEIKRDDFNDPD